METTEAEDKDNKDARAIEYNENLKVAVWDFGAEALPDVNNMLTADIINSFYSGATAGSVKNNIASFAIDKNGNIVSSAVVETANKEDQVPNKDGVEFCFSDGGNHKTHRIRTTNTAITRYDEKNLVIGSTTYNGYLYSNASKDKNVYIGVRLDAGDIMDVVVSSNGGAYTITVEDPDGKTQDFAKAAGASEIKYYAVKSGMYKIYNGTDEKLVVGRVTRTHTNSVTVSGSVTLPENAVAGLGLVFICNETGEEISAEIANGSYSITLNDQHSYTIAASDNAYVLSDADSKLELGKDSGNVTKNITITAVERYKLSGEIKGLDKDAVAALKDIAFEKPADKLYVPKITITKPLTEDGTVTDGAVTYEVMLEKGVEYGIRTEGINDYNLADSEKVTSEKITIEEETAQDLVYKKKPTYKVTLATSGATLTELEETNATITFTNINEEGYEYTFNIKTRPVGDDIIRLRDGVYSVKVKNSGIYEQKLTANLRINGKNTAMTIKFGVAPKEWDFGSQDFLKANADDIKDGYKGLVFSNVGRDSKGYATIANGKDEAGNVVADTGTIKIPVKTGEDARIVVTYLYNANVRFENEETASIATSDGSTSKAHTAEYTFIAGSSLINDGYITLTHVDGDVDGKTINKSYLTKIQILPNLSYKETITVGANEEIADGTTLGTGGYFSVALKNVVINEETQETVTGSVQKKVSGGSVTKVRLEKMSTGAIAFTVKTEKATVKANVMSTGKNTKTEVALVNANDEVQEEKGKNTTVTGTAVTTLTWENLPAGTYRLVAPGNAHGVDVVSVSVDEIVTFTTDSGDTAEEVDETYTFNASALKVSGNYNYDYTTINEALEEVRSMNRKDENGLIRPVTISIQPGDYEEMLVIDVDNVKFVNAAGDEASIELTDAGVHIADNAVRITSYYGHGYTYYSMGSDCKWNEEVLRTNLKNGYPAFQNPGTGTTSGSYWNATVVITGSNISAEGIIFENSFNQYVSKKAAADEIVPQKGAAKEGSIARNLLPEGSTKVQEKDYVERAAALAIANNCKQIYFDNCKFIGRQDTLYGGTDVTAGFYNCSVYGGTDYIFGGMTAVFAKCDLVFNTNDQTDAGKKNDVGYITAPQQKEGTRGYLMYNCHVTSTTPGVDTASEFTSKPGYLGRPWGADTTEAVFYKTVVDAADTSWYESLGGSLIQPLGWQNTLSGESALCQEFGTYEYAKDIDNSTGRAKWATVLAEEKLKDGKPITVETFLGSWNPFDGKNMDIVIPTDKVDNKPAGNVTVNTYVLDASAMPNETNPNDTKGDKMPIADGTKLGDKDYFSVALWGKVTQGDASVDGKVVKRNGSTNLKGLEIEKWISAGIQFKVTGTADIDLLVSSTGGSNYSRVALINVADKSIQKADSCDGKDKDGNALKAQEDGSFLVYGNEKSPSTLSYKNLSAGTYAVVSPYDSANNRGAWLIKATVEESVIGGGEESKTEEHLFDATKLGTTAKDQDPIENGTVFENYFTVVTDTVKDAAGADYTGKVKKRTKDKADNAEIIYVEVDKWLSSTIQFKVTGTADVEIAMCSTGGSNTSVVGLVDASGNILANAEGITTITGTTAKTMTYKGLAAGTYRVASPGKPDDNMNRGARVYTIKVVETTGSTRPPRAEWTGVANPEITGAALAVDKDGNTDAKTVAVTINANVGYDGGDKVEVAMYECDETGKIAEKPLATQSSTVEQATHTITFSPEKTGTYKFIATLSRSNETEFKNSAEFEYKYTLPLGKTHINTITNLGKPEGAESGSVEIDWSAVDEATNYLIIATTKAAEGQEATEVFKHQTEDAKKTTFEVTSGLTVGETYVFSVAAVRGTETGEADTAEKKISEEKQMKWTFATYGSSSSTVSDGYTDADHVGKLAITNFTDNKRLDRKEKEMKIDSPDDVRVWSMNGAGKIVPNSTDGIAFYYTEVDPTKNNFKLSAIAHVNQWGYSNGQDGFGLLAADTVGEHGDGSDFWTNSYMAVATKVEYYWDKENGTVSDEGDRANMRLGIGTIERYGVTAENLSQFEDAKTVGAATTNFFKTSTTPLDTTVHKGTWNLIANNIGGLGDIQTVANPYTDIWFQIELNNTGYYISYAPAKADGSYDEEAVVTNKYYSRDRLSQIDTDSVFVGFFASRNADITYKNYSLTTSDYQEGAEPEEAEVTYITPSFSITSASTANSPEYELSFSANWEGSVIIRDEMDNVVVSAEEGKVKDLKNETTGEYTKTYNAIKKKVTLGIGTNTFKVAFTPSDLNTYNPDSNKEKYDAGKSDKLGFTQLLDYTPQTFTFTVTYKQYGKEGEALYVSPLGAPTGVGTKARPLDIYTAIKYVQPGQTIYLMEGTYDLSRTVRIERGINGTKDKRIFMLADPEAKTRPVFDFGGRCEGVILAGDYWYLKGFDVTRSENGRDGVRVCGEYNVLEQLNTYKNGNTGIQISRFLGSDLWEDWPRYNLILNCTSYLNSDSGYEDADGFAAKLTIAEGNVFDGCISAYNADDGWDLFAKVESGEIGSVMIRNSIAYKNGYVLVKDGELSLDGEVVDAGNGNGFKMGGTSLFSHADAELQHHTVQNSAAFYNKAKGIDSNSCPNIQVIDSVSYNNEGYNIAFYTNVSTDTDYVANGLISFRTDFLTIRDQLTLSEKNPENKQDMSKIYNNSSYYWNETAKASYPKDEKGNSITTGSFVKKTWFESIDFAAFERNAFGKENGKTTLDGLRYSDGSINMHGFLTLTGVAPVDSAVGDASFTDNEKDRFTVDITTVPETSGEVVNGDTTGEINSDVIPEDVAVMPSVDSGETLGLWVGVIDKQYCGYTGKAVTPEVRVYEGTTLLRKGKDYTISYKNNKEAYVESEVANNPAYQTAKDKNKVPTIIIKGTGNYSGIVFGDNNKQNNTVKGADAITFDIIPTDIGSDTLNRVAANDIALIDKGSGVKASSVKPVLTFNGKKLSSANEKDFVYQILDEKGAAVNGDTISKGNYTIQFTGRNNFTGTRTAKLYVVDSADKEKLASSFKVDKIPEQQRKGYTGYDNTGDPIPVTLTTTGDAPSLVVKDKAGTPLVEGTHYTVSYANNIEVGNATAIISGIAPHYFGTKEVKFKIVAPQLAKLESNQDLLGAVRVCITSGESKTLVTEKQLFSDPLTFKGKAVEVDGLRLEVRTGAGENDWKELERDRDYTLTYKGNNKAGTASVVFKGIGNYSGTLSKSFKILPYEIDVDSDKIVGGTFAKENGKYADITVAVDKGGNKPGVVLTVGGYKMRKGKDYTVSYRNNNWAAVQSGKEPTIIITGKGALKGKLERPFNIVAKNLSDSENPITMTIEDVGISKQSGDGYTGKGIPKIVLKDANGKALSAGSDYDKNFTFVISNKKEETPTHKISEDGTEAIIANESDVLTVKVTVKAGATAKDVSKGGYTGEISGEYRVAYAKRSIKSAKVIVNYNTDKHNPSDNKKYFDYTAEAIRLYELKNDAKLTDEKRTDEDNYYYTLNVTVNGVDRTLRYGKDFEILKYSDGTDSYVKNIAKGTAKVTIRGIGEFAGTKVVTFKIGTKDFSEVSWWEQIGAKLTTANVK